MGRGGGAGGDTDVAATPIPTPTPARASVRRRPTAAAAAVPPSPSKSPPPLPSSSSSPRPDACKPQPPGLRPPRNVLLPPRGKSLFPLVWDQDPTRPAAKGAMVATTVLCLAVLPSVPDWLVGNLDRMDGSWDFAIHGFVEGSDATPAASLHEILDRALGLSRSFTLGAFATTVGVYAGLILLDLLLGWRLASSTSSSSPAPPSPPSSAKTVKMERTRPYPPSWNVDNAVCYEDMFSEPTRYGRLLRRPGNTVSNAPYLYGAVCVLASCYQSCANDDCENSYMFLFADALFGLLLLVLAISSTVWHMSNAPLSQYVDLWSMDACIVYLLLRCACLGVLRLLLDHLPPNALLGHETARTLAGWTCLLLFSSTCAALANVHATNYRKRWLHGLCPFSCRARLLGTSDVLGRGHFDIHVSTVCAYSMLPVLYSIVPTIVLLYVGYAGSLVLARVTFGTLVVGWSYRMLDRWTLDGCWPLEVALGLGGGAGGSSLRTLGAAVLSPTAVLHALTGITLLAGYAHARSVDGVAWP